MNCCKQAGGPAAPSPLSEQARLAVEKANRCLRLARIILDIDAVHLLQEMAADYLREAERLARKDD